MMGILSDQECKEVLGSHMMGRLGIAGEDFPYVVPVNYLFDGSSIIAHSQLGLKIKMMRKAKTVCFEVEEVRSFTNWKSVIAWGSYEEIKDEQEKWKTMELFVEKMIHAKVSETARPPEISAMRAHPREKVTMIVFRININKMTGRFETGEQ